MKNQLSRLDSAIANLQQGKMIILTDDADRENEGDLIFPAENVNAEMINFMIRHCSGIICLPMQALQLKRLGLSWMVAPHENTSHHGTPFATSIEAKTGVSTGVSAADRARTIQAAIHANATADDIVKPGHIFPLLARDGGVLERPGHTEGAVDLVRLAGFKPAAVLCEVMNSDGTMAKGQRLRAFAELHQIKMLAIDEIITHRLAQEIITEEISSTNIPLDNYGLFKLQLMREKYNKQEHIVLSKGDVKTMHAPLVRIHSACLTGDLFGSQRCDCNQQLHYSLEKISAEGGILIYLNQEGRGIGLSEKIKAYALQEKGLDTVTANRELGWPADARKYYMAAHILRQLNLAKIRLLTNNPHKIEDLTKYGIAEIERIAMPAFCNQHNKKYLQTKQIKLRHYPSNDSEQNLYEAQ